MIDAKLKDEYWGVVEDCLVVLHGCPPEKARGACLSLREKIEKPSREKADDLFYHNEPFNVACDIERNQLPLDDVVRSKYERILNLHQW
jgi:hypothetical protein